MRRRIKMEKRVKHILYPDTNIIIALFRDVENAKLLKQAVMSGQFDAALVKPSMVLDEFLVTVAANKAVHSKQCGKMITKTVHSEILFNLSAGRKITDAFKKIGMGDSDTSVLVTIVGTVELTEETFSKLKALIQGRQVPLDELASLAQLETIQKEYKLSEEEVTTCSCVEAIASRIAAKDVIT